DVTSVLGEGLQRLAVALIDEEEVSVREEELDQGVQEAGPRRDDGLVVDSFELLEGVPPDRVKPQVQLEEDVLLALSVVVERGFRAAAALGVSAQRGPLVPLLVKELHCDVEDPLPGLIPSALGSRPRI